MVIVITVFGEDTLFGETTKFGYYELKGDFTADAINDIDEILQEAGKTYLITEQTATVDSMGNTTAISSTEFYCYAHLESLTQKDRKLIDMGIAIPGDMKGFFKESYNSNYIKEGQILTDLDGIKWRIVQINERNITGDVIFVVAIMRNIDLEGS